MTDRITKSISLAIVMASVLLVTACGNTEQDEAKMRQLAKRFEAESNAAQSSPRITISSHLSRLSDIRLDLSELKISEDCQELKGSYLGAFETIEGAFSAFASEETETVTAHMLTEGMSALGSSMSGSCEFYGLRRLEQIIAPVLVLKGHSDNVQSAAFSPDGSRVVTASWDNTARIWDAGTGKELAVLWGHSGWVYSAAFSPDGSRVVTGSGDNTARIWVLHRIIAKR